VRPRKPLEISTHVFEAYGEGCRICLIAEKTICHGWNTAETRMRNYCRLLILRARSFLIGSRGFALINLKFGPGKHPFVHHTRAGHACPRQAKETYDRQRNY